MTRKGRRMIEEVKGSGWKAMRPMVNPILGLNSLRGFGAAPAKGEEPASRRRVKADRMSQRRI